MARLPVVDDDAGIWGDVLNEFLTESHNGTGTLKSTSVSAAGAEMTANKGNANGYASLDATGKVPSTQIPTPTVQVAKGGTLTGTRPQINFVEGTNITITAADSSANGRVDVTINSSASGGVTSVNGETGEVTLSASDVGADASGAAATVASSAMAFIRYDTGSSAYPARSTATSDTDRTVVWIGPSAPTIGGSGAVNDVDVWWKTP